MGSLETEQNCPTVCQRQVKLEQVLQTALEPALNNFAGNVVACAFHTQCDIFAATKGTNFRFI
jgi:hypothetical protein